MVLFLFQFVSELEGWAVPRISVKTSEQGWLLVLWSLSAARVGEVLLTELQSIILFTKKTKSLFFESGIMYHNKKNNSPTRSLFLDS